MQSIAAVIINLVQQIGFERTMIVFFCAVATICASMGVNAQIAHMQVNQEAWREANKQHLEVHKSHQIHLMTVQNEMREQGKEYRQAVVDVGLQLKEIVVRLQQK